MHFPAEQISNLHRLAARNHSVPVRHHDHAARSRFWARGQQRALGWVAFIGTLVALASLRLVSLDQGYAYSESD